MPTLDQDRALVETSRVHAGHLKAELELRSVCTDGSDVRIAQGFPLLDIALAVDLIGHLADALSDRLP